MMRFMMIVKANKHGPYALQAAIAACHARALTPEQTDWGRIAALYDVLAQLAPSPVVELNRNARERELLLERARACAGGPTPPEPR